jgi:hypothetical protein
MFWKLAFDFIYFRQGPYFHISDGHLCSVHAVWRIHITFFQIQIRLFSFVWIRILPSCYSRI